MNSATDLHTAAFNGNRELVENLIANGADLNAKDEDGETALGYAAQMGHRELAELLIEKDADVNAKGNYALSPLCYAAQSGQKKMAELLIAKGADLNAKDGEWETPLCYAAEMGHKEMAELLIEKGADLNAKDNNGETPVFHAAHGCHEEMVQLLIDHGAEIDLGPVDKYGRTLLHAAAQGGCKILAEQLIQKGVDVNVKDDHGETPLLKAAMGQEKLTEWLIANGADVNARGEYRITPLFEAALGGHQDIVKLLIAKGAEIDPITKTLDGETLLHAAARNNLKFLAEQLIQKGADLNAQANIEATPLFMAAYYGNQDIVDILLGHGAEINTTLTTWDDETLLHAAARGGCKKLAEQIIQKGADVNAQDEAKQTPLFLAAYWSNKEMAQLLIDRGAEIDIQSVDKDGRTLLHAAARSDIRSLVEQLIKKGTDVNAKNDEGTTPLHLAAEMGHEEIVERLIDKDADVNARNDDRTTPLSLAAYRAHQGIVDLLLARGAVVDPTAGTGNGGNLLHEAAKGGCKSLVEQLIQKGADVNAKERSQETPLFNAALEGHQDIVDILLAHGAEIDPTTVTYGMKTLLHAAAQGGCKNLVEQLIQKGAALNIKEGSGETPLSLAIEEGHDEVADLLRKHGAGE